ncbi:MAG: methyl-accepting chemotaxis protein, partial [Oscillospiraceae bacterium]|nr:methyl-accepting chemotaxis protein [Oscillospiraceae bacterium]
VNVFTIHQASGHTDTLMQMHTESGMSTLKSQMEALKVRFTDLTADFDASGFASPDRASEIVSLWESKKKTESDFAAFYDASGNQFWKTDNFDLGNVRLGYETHTGVVNDPNAGLVVHCMRNLSNGNTMVTGMYLTETSWLDDVKAETSSEVTIISGKTRLATTIADATGKRATGTDISDTVHTKVSNGGTFEGTTDILGQKHYVIYEPLVDVNGDIVGAYFSGYSAAESEALKLKLILTSTIMAVIIGFASLFVIGIFCIQMIIKPIQAAEKLADSMHKGYLNEPTPAARFGNDEVGDFVRKLEATRGTLNLYITDIDEVITQMATGDFTVKPKVDYVGDFSNIQSSFERIEKSLHEIIGSINSSAKDVKTGAAQIAEGSQVLADGTTRQAAAIQELSASINEIAAKGQVSAKNATEASKVSKLSTDKITYQNEEVKNMLSAMEEIKEKSDQIQNIIKAIDDIAFQTNILALNAAIEAARAGVAGKGFAVVADEVRALAGKSAESAEQTGLLINATIAAVDKGTIIAQNTADTMKEVTELSTRTNSYISEISSAAEDQAESIEQVKVGIDQISTVVQQNSATAEETAASCEELSSQSAVLEEQISKLKVED